MLYRDRILRRLSRWDTVSEIIVKCVAKWWYFSFSWPYETFWYNFYESWMLEHFLLIPCIASSCLSLAPFSYRRKNRLCADRWPASCQLLASCQHFWRLWYFNRRGGSHTSIRRGSWKLGTFCPQTIRWWTRFTQSDGGFLSPLITQIGTGHFILHLSRSYQVKNLQRTEQHVVIYYSDTGIACSNPYLCFVVLEWFDSLCKESYQTFKCCIFS